MNHMFIVLNNSPRKSSKRPANLSGLMKIDYFFRTRIPQISNSTPVISLTMFCFFFPRFCFFQFLGPTAIGQSALLTQCPAPDVAADDISIFFDSLPDVVEQSALLTKYPTNDVAADDISIFFDSFPEVVATTRRPVTDNRWGLVIFFFWFIFFPPFFKSTFCHFWIKHPFLFYFFFLLFSLQFFFFSARICAVFAYRNSPGLPRPVSTWIPMNALQCSFTTKSIPLPDASSRCGSCALNCAAFRHARRRSGCGSLLHSKSERKRRRAHPDFVLDYCALLSRTACTSHLRATRFGELDPPGCTRAHHYAKAVSPDGARCWYVPATAA